MKSFKKHLNNRKGMTLIEILIVITLIALTGTFAATKFMRMQDEGKQNASKGLMSEIGVALNDYRRHCNSYPTTEQGLKALIEKPSTPPSCDKYDPEGYINAKNLKDGWGHEFVYESDGNKYQLKSLGSDGREGGDAYAKDFTNDE